jgi:UDP-2,3-diacylglucosamine pyrophosphatase LpxH
LGNINIQEDYVLESNGKKYFVLHGDVFDVFITKMKWLAKIGGVAYEFSLWINRWYNRFRSWRGKPYLSISKKIKESVKFATKFIGDFEDHLVSLAKKKGYDGVICGHIHYPIIKKIDGIEYLNSGDWVENMSCLVETHDGEWKLVFYNN